MKLKRMFSLLVSLALMVALFPMAVFSTPPMIQYTLTLNGEQYFGNIQIVNPGAKLEMAVENVTVNGVAVAAEQVSYQWGELCEDPNRPGFVFRDIPGATQNTYTVDSYAGVTQYTCSITVENSGGSSCVFSFKEDSLSLTGSANKPCTYEEEGDHWVIEGLSVGDSITLTVTPQSTLDNPNYTYSWAGGVAYLPTDREPQGEVTNQTTNTLTVEKLPGEQFYYCEVSDGNITKSIYFTLMAKKSMTSEIKVNGQVPATYAGTYAYVTNPGEEVKVEIPTSTTGSKLDFSWYYANDNMSAQRIDHTGSTLTYKKAAPTENDPYAWEVFECYVEDGNDLIRYWLMLFCLDPETPLAEAKKIGANTPDVNIQTSDTDLANSVLSAQDMRIMADGAPAEVLLTTEQKGAVSDAEKKAIDDKLGENGEIGMYLDMNLYKDVAGMQTQITETNREIQLSIDLPKELLNQDAKTTRTYQIIRMHDGVAETLDCTLDEKTGKLVFDTDKFSTYTVVYTDTEVTEQTKPADTAKPSESSKPVNGSANTGDDCPLVLLAMTSLLSLCAALALLFRRKYI